MRDSLDGGKAMIATVKVWYDSTGRPRFTIEYIKSQTVVLPIAREEAPR
jgi:hypothetical protein